MRAGIVIALLVLLTGGVATATASASPTHQMGPYPTMEACEAAADAWRANPGWTASHCGRNAAGWYFIGRH